MKTLILAGLATVLASSAALASGNPLAPFMNPSNPTRPTVSITGVAAVGAGSTAVNVRQTSDFNAAMVGVVSPNAAVNVTQVGKGFNAASVGTVGTNSNVSVGQFGAKIGNFGQVFQRGR
jgi:hypothetical protein